MAPGRDPGLEPVTTFHEGAPWVGTPGSRDVARWAEDARLDALLRELAAGFGPCHWWPAATPFEVLVGAVLTQNTAWRNVELALEELRAARALDPTVLLELPPARLAELVRSSGTFRVKAERLAALSSWYLEVGGLTALRERPLEPLRAALLEVRGIGPETADSILCYAAGRRTFLRELGVEHLGLAPDRPYLEVDDRMRVTDGVWGVGDIAGEGLFTHLAIRQAAVAAADILGDSPESLNLDALSAVTFTDPEIGSVGLTEAEAIAAGLDVDVAFKLVGHTARGWLHAAGNEGFIKLVVDRDRGVLVGATSVGPHGGEVLGLLALAVHAEIPIATLRSMIYAYPTFHKGIEDALNELDHR